MGGQPLADGLVQLLDAPVQHQQVGGQLGDQPGGHLLGGQPDRLGGRGLKGSLGHLLNPAVGELAGDVAAQPGHQPPAARSPSGVW